VVVRCCTRGELGVIGFFCVYTQQSPDVYHLSLHVALPIWLISGAGDARASSYLTQGAIGANTIGSIGGGIANWIGGGGLNGIFGGGKK